MNQKEREAMQAALEALEWAWGGEPLPSKEYEAMQLLRAALVEPDYWQEEARRYAANADYWRQRYESLAEPEVDDVLEQEVFVWYDDETGETWTPGFVQDFGFPVGLRPLYSAPSIREWRGLTDEEIADISDQWATDELPDIYSVMRAIEATLKEKNHG